MKKGVLGFFIIGSAVVWGGVLIGCAIVLKGTPYKEAISNIVAGGAIFHLLFIWGPIGFKIKKNK